MRETSVAQARLTHIAFEGRVREMEVESVDVGPTAVAAVARMKP